MEIMEMIAGLSTTILIVGLGHATCQSRSLPFYSTVLIVIALAYVLFAVMAAAPSAILLEGVIATAFISVTVAAARWQNVRAAGFLVATGLAAHGGYDLVHPLLVPNPVVPGWWPLFCAVVDMLLGGWVLLLLRQGTLAVPHEQTALRSSR
jgi:hypothetical protein